jgi:spermidine synthase
LFTGGVWDLLGIAPLFADRFSPPSQPCQAASRSKVLMLGVGGGSAIHQLNKLLKPDVIVGIEFDPVHIQIAQTHFGLIDSNIKLIEADAFDWVKQNRRRFDIVVDDLFVDAPGDPVRPFALNDTWLNQLLKKLTDNGVLIQNHLLNSHAKQVAEELRQHFSSAILLTVPRYENVVLAMFKQPIDAKTKRKFIHAIVAELDKAAARKLKFAVRQIF